MKSIDTLVEDIYGLFSTDFSPDKQDIKNFGEKLANHLTKRIAEERGEPNLRLSNLGTPCDRKLWYSINTPNDAEPLSSQTRLKFLYGDILEELLLFLAEQAGHTVEGQQDELEINGVKGHRDAIIDGVVVDVKSASSRSFDKFTNHLSPDSDPFGYLTQLFSYARASEKDSQYTQKGLAGFLAVDKTLGKICLDLHAVPEIDYGEVVEQKREMLNGETPERPYEPTPDGKSGNEKLSTVCSYCPFKHKCWEDANDGKGLRTFLYSDGPRYLTTVKREPNVIEVDRTGKFIERV